MPDNLSEQCSHNGPNAVRLGSMLDQDLLPLTNSRARIRPLRHADAEVYAAGTEDPLVRQFAHLPEDRYTSASVRAVIDQVAAPALDRGDLALLAIADPRTDAFAGSAVVFDVDETRGSAEGGLWGHPAHRGQGLSAAALERRAGLAARKSGRASRRAVHEVAQPRRRGADRHPRA